MASAELKKRLGQFPLVPFATPNRRAVMGDRSGLWALVPVLGRVSEGEQSHIGGSCSRSCRTMPDGRPRLREPDRWGPSTLTRYRPAAHD